MKPQRDSIRLINWRVLILSLLLVSCQDDLTTEDQSEVQFVDCTVAVVLPASKVDSRRWERTLHWALENMEKAQRNLSRRVRLHIEWYNEEQESIENLGTALSERADVVAVIGPNDTKKLELMAERLSLKRKTLITPTCSSEEVIRRYSKKDFLWALTETDITQCEILLYRAQKRGAKSVSLLAPDDLYGKTFYDWFAFQATELGLDVKRAISYTEATRDRYVCELLESEVDFLICTPSTVEDICFILEKEKEMLYKAIEGDEPLPPSLLFSDRAMSAELLEISKDNNYLIEGIGIHADPASGFSIAYTTHFDEAPTSSEVQVYDALVLVAFAVADCSVRGKISNEEMNEALKRIVDADGVQEITWMGMGMQYAFDAINQQMGYLNIRGAAGNLSFDKNTYTSVLQSIYAHFMILVGDPILIDYYSSSGSHRVESTVASWNWNKTVEELIDDKPINIVYPALDKQWALLVAGSEGWGNFRHQADVLAMYQLLKKSGFDDDHIILVMADDLAYNKSNPTPGTITIDGKNLYQNIELDYCIDSISPADIKAILNGEKSTHLPRVIESDANDNVLVFWSGHGIYGELCWVEKPEEFTNNGFTRQLFEATLQQMSDNKRYRKMLWLNETCHAASVTSASVGFPGVLTIASSKANETSKADLWSNSYRVYLSNAFTASLMQSITENSAITFRDLYYKLNRNTNASHIQIDNAIRFDNLYRSSIKEFIVKSN